VTLALVSCPANDKPHLVYEQTLAYNRALGDDCVHVINVNIQRSGKFFEEAEAAGIDFAAIGNVVFAKPERMSIAATGLGIHATNLSFAIQSGIVADYVLLHTTSDLPFRLGLGDYMRRFDLGQAPPRRIDKDNSPGFYSRAARDQSLTSFLRKIDFPVDEGRGPTLPFCRFEGSFYRWGLAMELFFLLCSHFGFDGDYHWLRPYPIEEILLPALADHLERHHKLTRTRHTVIVASEDGDPRFTGLSARKPMNEEHIPTLAGLEEEIFSFKFAPDSDSPVRDWVFGELGIPLDRRVRALA